MDEKLLSVDMKNVKHKSEKEVESNLGKSEVILEPRCPICGGILVTNYGAGISYTYCVDCDYNDYDYDL